MKPQLLLSALLLSFVTTGPASALASDDFSETAPDILTDAQKRVFNGPFEHVVCLRSGRLNVRGKSLRDVLFTANNYSGVKIFQGSGTKLKRRGRSYIKAQFPELKEKIGWVAEDLVRPRSRCQAAAQPVKIFETDKQLNEASELGSGGNRAIIRGLNDPNCCQWPVKGEPTADFASAQRRFGARRGSRRLHAACDLYRYKNEAIYAVAPGQVLAQVYPFYQGTYALEVRHSGGFVVRYGEITGKRAANIRAGAKVTMGQQVGYMGKVNSGCCEPMLHFELYSGARRGSLSGSNAYQRRSDLMDPTPYLRRWQDTSLKSRR